MAQIFVVGTQGRLSFDGVAVFATDGTGGAGTPVAFADQRIVFTKTSNNGYPDLVDGASYVVNKIPGVRMGSIQITGVVQPDRAFHTFLNTAFGPRSAGQLLPWMMNLTPHSGAAAVKATGIWWSSIRIFSAFSTSGGQQAVFFTLNGVVLDPDNTLGAATLTTPGYVGAQGAGIAPFSRASFTNDSTTTYDGVRSFDTALSNRLQVVPAIRDTANRLAAACVPGTIMGALNLSQLKGATNPLSMADGTYPINALLPTGDGTHALKVAGSWSYDSDGNSYAASDFETTSASYTLFSTSGTSTPAANGGLGYPFVASYA